MKYVIRLSDEGYYGHTPYSSVPLEDAIIFNSMKEARKMYNRLVGRLLKSDKWVVEIEPLK